MKVIKIYEHGGPEVMQYEEAPVPVPGKGQVLVKQGAIGVNFIDIYQRTGLYQVSLPHILGLEGSGTVEEIGGNVSEVRKGDRVAYAGVAGTYAEYSLVPADRVVKIPDSLDFKQGAAAMLQGMTAHYLTHRTYPIKAGDTALVHAAAGGVGLLLVQIARRLGAQVFGTVSTKQKAELAREAGADEVILYTEKDFEKEIKTLTAGKGVNVVYDSVGKTTFEKSLNCLAPMGYLVSFGQSSGKIDGFDPAVLGAKGSLFLTRPSLFHYIADRAGLEKHADEVLGWVASGELRLRVERTFELSEAPEAHRLLAGRKTSGKVLLIP